MVLFFLYNITCKCILFNLRVALKQNCMSSLLQSCKILFMRNSAKSAKFHRMFVKKKCGIPHSVKIERPFHKNPINSFFFIYVINFIKLKVSPTFFTHNLLHKKFESGLKSLSVMDCCQH